MVGLAAGEPNSAYQCQERGLDLGPQAAWGEGDLAVRVPTVATGSHHRWESGEWHAGAQLEVLAHSVHRAVAVSYSGLGWCLVPVQLKRSGLAGQWIDLCGLH